jgi:hypothetical protein
LSKLRHKDIASSAALCRVMLLDAGGTGHAGGIRTLTGQDSLITGMPHRQSGQTAIRTVDPFMASHAPPASPPHRQGGDFARPANPYPQAGKG